MLSLPSPLSPTFLLTFENLGVRAVGAEAARGLTLDAGPFVPLFFVCSVSRSFFSSPSIGDASLSSKPPLPRSLSPSLYAATSLCCTLSTALLLLLLLMLLLLLAVGQSVQHEGRGPDGTAKGSEEQQVGLELLGRNRGVRAARGEHRLRGGGGRWCNEAV